MTEGLTRDVRDAWRSLARVPSLLVPSLLSLGIGIGACLTVLSVLRAIEFPSLAYPAPSQLVVIEASNSARGATGYPLSLPDFADVRREARSFSSIAASTDETLTLTEGPEPVRLGVKRVSPDFFATLGSAPAIGRTFGGTDLATGPTDVIVLSQRVWMERFSSDARAIGRATHVGDRSYTIVGVMPSRFDESVDAWVPLSFDALSGPRDDRSATVVARLRVGVTRNAAVAELKAIASRLSNAHPEANGGWELGLIGLDRVRSRESGGGYYQLMAAVSVLLLIACANVANLLLSRGITRRRELGIRSALGATRGERARLLLADGVVLATGAAAIGFLLSVWGVDGVSALGGLPPSVHVPVDIWSVVAALALAIIVAVLIALAPALWAARLSPDAALRDGGARGASATSGQSHLRALLVCVEIACALVLVTGAGLMGRTLWNRQQRDLGFVPQNAMKGEITFEASRYRSASARRSATTDLLARVAPQGGVRSVGVTSFPLAARLGTPIPISEVGSPNDLIGADMPRVIESVSSGYFPAIGATVRRGRGIVPSDGFGTSPVVVVNEEFARRAWPAGDAVGRQLRMAAVDADGVEIAPTFTVVGVVASMLRSSMHDRTLPRVYLSFDQHPGRTLTLYVRTTGAAEGAIGGIKAALRQVDPMLFLENSTRLTDDNAEFLRPTRLYALLLSGFGALAVLLAAIGVYASLSYSVGQRTREMAIRLALGADPRQLTRLVLGEGLRLGAIGAIVGIASALGATRVLGSLLYGVGATDPASFAVATTFLLLLVALACWIPARRTSATDPAITLRVE